jgi:DNA-directed RNA polymerase specialized sigma24 family protein
VIGQRTDDADALMAAIFAPRREPRPSPMLQALAHLAETAAVLRQAERSWLDLARADGYSWREIGDALGIAPQSARERVHRRARPPLHER